MRQVECQRHIVRCLAGSIPEHHPLVAGSLCIRFRFEIFGCCCAVHPLVDIRTLVVDCREDTAGIGFKHVFTLRVANPSDHFAGDLLNVQIGVGLYLAGQNYLPGRHQCFAGYLTAGIPC
ncbi:hypothetical protein D3C87_1576470 [compost metagenome]